MDFQAIVEEKAREMGVLNDQNELSGLTSLTVLDFVVTLEDATGLEVPPEEVVAPNFVSVDSLVVMLRRISNGNA